MFLLSNMAYSVKTEVVSVVPSEGTVFLCPVESAESCGTVSTAVNLSCCTLRRSRVF